MIELLNQDCMEYMEGLHDKAERDLLRIERLEEDQKSHARWGFGNSDEQINEAIMEG
jgi:hypothetical protein